MREDEQFRLFVASRMVAARKARGLTQKEASELANVTASSWANYEAADRGMKEYTLIKIAKALGTTAAYLLGETDEVNSGASGYAALTGGQVRTDLSQPLISFSVAGLNKLGYQEQQLTMITVRDDAINGMTPGDLAVIDTSKTDIEHPGLYAIKSERGQYWLRYIRAELTGGFTLFADNKASTPDLFMDEDQAGKLEITGQYIGHFHWANKSR